MYPESEEDEDGAIVVTTATITGEVIGTRDNTTKAEEEVITGGMGSRISPTGQLDVLVKDGEETRTGTRTRV